MENQPFKPADPAADPIKLIYAKASGGRVVVEGSIAAVRDSVLSGQIVILKEVFDSVDLIRIRRAVHSWIESVDEQNVDRLQAARSWHRRDINPARSQTKHIFDTCCFVPSAGDAIFPLVQNVFAPMAILWQDLTEQQGDFAPRSDGLALRPQAIHYPSGGGFFDWHEHALEPQRIGLILCLSRYGENFSAGGTAFRSHGRIVEPGSAHDIGDICLFRYDAPHAVSQVDPGQPLSWDADTGRWTFVLPLM